MDNIDSATTRDGPPVHGEAARLRELIDSLGERIFWKNRHGRYLGCNEQFARDVGIADPAEVIGRNDFELCWPEHAETVRAEDRRLIAGEVAEISSERCLLLPGQNRIWVRTWKHPLRDVHGRIVGVVGRYRDISEEHHAALAARAVQERTETAISTDRIGLWDWNPRSGTVIVSRSWWQLLGEADGPAEIADAVYFDRVHPDDRARGTQEMRGVLAGEQSVLDFEARVLTAGGHYKWVRSVGRVLENGADGAPLRLIGQNIDVDVARRRESALREVTAALDHATDLVFVADPRTLHAVYVNAAAVQFTGVGAEELRRRDLLTLVEPDDEARLRATLAGLRAGPQRTASMLVRLRHGDGGVRPVEASLRYVPTLGAEGCFVTIVRDMSTWLEREQRLSELYSAMDTAADAIFIRDVESGHFVYSNRAASALTGYSAEEIAGFDRFVFDVGHATPEREAQRAALRADPSRAQSLETEFVRRDGQRVPVAMSINLVPGHGACGRYITIARDVSEQRRREAELRQARAHAESAARSKSTFLANMSHEIRTPLHGVIGMLDLLLASSLDAEQGEFAATAQRSAHALLAIVNDVLDFSRMEAGKLNIDRVTFDLHALVKDLVRGAAPRAEAKQLELLTAVTADVPRRVTGDPGRLRQVLGNLLGNAVKFTQAGEVMLAIDRVRMENDRCLLRFTVRDTGIGIDRAKQALLFQSFIQADDSITREFGGTGLGLAICRQLTELMGGTIGVASAPGVGAEFWCELPFTCTDDDAVPRGALADLHQAHVLVVDRNQTARTVLAAYLKVWGVRVEGVADPASALDYLRFAAIAGEPVQIAIIDMAVGDGDGLELGALIAAQNEFARPALVLTSSCARHGDAQAARAAGFDAYLPKPTLADDVHACLVRALGRRSEGDADTGADTTALITRHTLREERANGRHLLVVEDNPVNQAVARGMLAQLGYGVDLAVNGEAAITALANHDYALVLMDCQMPVMDGYAATRAIRAGDGGVRNPEVPIIAMTAHALPDERGRCLAAGMSDYITKPLGKDVLAAALGRWLAPHAAPAANSTTVTSQVQGMDLVRLGARFDHQQGLLAGLFEAFLGDVPARVSALCAAVSLGDARETQQHAHQIKGVAGNLCAAALQDYADALETAAVAGELEPAAHLIALIAREVDYMRQQAEAALGALPPVASSSARRTPSNPR